MSSKGSQGSSISSGSMKSFSTVSIDSSNGLTDTKEDTTKIQTFVYVHPLKRAMYHSSINITSPTSLSLSDNYIDNSDDEESSLAFNFSQVSKAPPNPRTSYSQVLKPILPHLSPSSYHSILILSEEVGASWWYTGMPPTKTSTPSPKSQFLTYLSSALYESTQCAQITCSAFELMNDAIIDLSSGNQKKHLNLFHDNKDDSVIIDGLRKHSSDNPKTLENLCKRFLENHQRQHASSKPSSTTKSTSHLFFRFHISHNHPQKPKVRHSSLGSKPKSSPSDYKSTPTFSPSTITNFPVNEKTGRLIVPNSLTTSRGYDLDKQRSSPLKKSTPPLAGQSKSTRDPKRRLSHSQKLHGHDKEEIAESVLQVVLLGNIPTEKNKESNAIRQSFLALGVMISILNGQIPAVGFSWRSFRLTHLLEKSVKDEKGKVVVVMNIFDKPERARVTRWGLELLQGAGKINESLEWNGEKGSRKRENTKKRIGENESKWKEMYEQELSRRMELEEEQEFLKKAMDDTTREVMETVEKMERKMEEASKRMKKEVDENFVTRLKRLEEHIERMSSEKDKDDLVRRLKIEVERQVEELVKLGEKMKEWREEEDKEELDFGEEEKEKEDEEDEEKDEKLLDKAMEMWTLKTESSREKVAKDFESYLQALKGLGGENDVNNEDRCKLEVALQKAVEALTDHLNPEITLTS